MLPNQALLDPAAEVAEEAERERNGRLTFVAFRVTLRQPIKNALVQVDVRTSSTFLRRGSRDGSSPAARVQTDQDKPCQMAQRSLRSLHRQTLSGAPMDGLHLLGAPAHTKEVGGFLASEPSRARRASRR